MGKPSVDKKHVVVGQDDSSSSPLSPSFKVNLTDNSVIHKCKDSCAFKRVCGQILYYCIACLPHPLFFFLFQTPRVTLYSDAWGL